MIAFKISYEIYKIYFTYINYAFNIIVPVPLTMPIRRRVRDLTETFLAQPVDSLDNIIRASLCLFPF